MRPALFFVGLILGLSHYEVWRFTNAVLDAREARFRTEALMSIARSERLMDQAAALVVEMCAQNDSQACVVEFYE